MNRFGWTLGASLAAVLAAPAPLQGQNDYVPDARASPGGSDFTWQAMGGVGIDVGACCTALAAYRHLDADYQSDDFVYDA